jgi:hypothetical protein
MSVADRRQVLRLAAATALLPVLAGAPLRALAAARFAPPAVPMRYTRALRREMADGNAFVVTRSFAVRFLGDARGFRVDGEQVDVTVDAPARLAQFAELERRRSEVGLFPLTLDAHGQIYGARVGIDTDELDAAVREALATLDGRAFSPGERDEIARFVSALHQGAAKIVTELPKDLFAPADPERTTTRDVALPGGQEGEVTVRFTARTDPGTGLMEEARREVVTDLAGDRRRTSENWILSPL